MRHAPATRSAHDEYHILSRRDLSSGVYALKISRCGLGFEPGQHIHLGLPDSPDLREYSIYSGVDDPYIEVLVREVEDGFVSKRLKALDRGDRVRLAGPFGYFTLPEEKPQQSANLLFIATGTGIAPFRCFSRSCSDLNFHLLHGIRTDDDRFDYLDFGNRPITSCVSRQKITKVQAFEGAGSDGNHRWFSGRVTEYLRANPVSAATICYLCGNCDMIYEAFDILQQYGVSTSNMYTEVYF